MPPQISKIQLRRGVQTDLSVGSLDVGEIAFTTDTSRLFVGPDANTVSLISLVHDAQTIGGFPYDNVEILTELSPANQIVFDNKARNISTAFVVSVPMAMTGAGHWATLMVQQVSASDPNHVFQTPFVIDAQSHTGTVGTAHISYHIIDYATGIPMRTGRLTLFCQDNAFPPNLIDDATVTPFSGFIIPGGSLVDPNLRYGMISFRAVPISTGISIQYQIAMSSPNPPTPVMYFRVEQPLVLSSSPITPASNTITTTYLSNAAPAVVSVTLTGDVTGTGNTVGSTITIPTTLEAQPYTIGAYVPGLLLGSQVMMFHHFPRAVTFPSDFGATVVGGTSGCDALVAATSSVTFTIYQCLAASNPTDPTAWTSVGTISISPSAYIGTFSSSGTPVSFATGDRIKIVSPSSVDSSLASVAITIVADRS